MKVYQNLDLFWSIAGCYMESEFLFLSIVASIHDLSPMHGEHFLHHFHRINILSFKISKRLGLGGEELFAPNIYNPSLC